MVKATCQDCGWSRRATGHLGALIIADAIKAHDCEAYRSRRLSVKMGWDVRRYHESKRRGA